MCKVMALLAVIMGLGLLCCILLGFRCVFPKRGCRGRRGYIGLKVWGLGLTCIHRGI